MNFPYFVARRYFLSGRKTNFINVISILSMVGVAFSTAALIIVLSVFNGLEDLLRSLYTSFDPELKIEVKEGKAFVVTDSLLQQLKQVPGVAIVSEVIEDYAYVRYRDANMVAIIRGVSNNFLEQHRLDNHVSGELALYQDSIPRAIVGAGVQATLSISLEDESMALQVFYIKSAKASGSLDPSNLYTRKSIRPGAVFSIEKTYDENYIFLPLAFASDLLDYGKKRTFLEVKTDPSTPASRVKEALQQKLGNRFRVLTNEEQHQDLYKLLKMEKLFTFMALVLLILVGSINIFFCLMMLALDKKKDVTLFTAFGATPTTIKKIFVIEGGIIAFVGAGIGLLLGAVICYLQGRFGIIGMGMENAIVSSYPVRMDPVDFGVTTLMIVAVTFIVSFYPARKAAHFYSPEYL
jgi:lipoprotein-releasing system permease protein